MTEQPHPSAPGNNEQKKSTSTKFQANSQYFTIAIYVIIVVAIAAVIFKAILSFENTMAALHRALNLMMPFIIGALIAFILNPAVKKFCYLFEKYTKLKRKGVIKVLSILITYLLLLSLVFVSFFGIIPEIMDNLTDLINSYTTAIPLFLEETTLFFNSLEEQFPSLDVQVLQDAVNEIIPTILNSMKDFAANLVPTLYTLSMSIVQLLIDLIIALIVSVYMLTDKQILLNSFKAVIYAFLPQKQIPTLISTLKDCNNIFSSFIIGKAIDSLIIGILCFILMTILQLPYTLLISLIVGVTNMIPYFGPFIGAVPGIIIMLIISPLKALIFGLMILALQQFDGLILGPKILGDSVGLRPLWIIIAITIGGSVAGVLGMFLGVPIVAVIRYLMIRILKYRLTQRHILNNVNLE